MERYAIIPKPVQLEPLEGYFQITDRTTISTSPQFLHQARYIRDFLSRATGLNLHLHQDTGELKNSINLCIDESTGDMADEGYHLHVNSDTIKISAKSQKGILYGFQSIRQLLPHEIESSQPTYKEAWYIPCCIINDQPRFTWRGFMIDEGRHFQGIQNIQRIIDLMALLKLNVLHWHLTEDQGWRIEINKFPNLTKIGSRREGTATSFRDNIRRKHDQIIHSGFYSQNEIREIVMYAEKHQITVIPEIEFPGHSMAALAAYPELSCTGGPFQVPTSFGIFKDIYCAGKEETYNFIKFILEEIITLFPSRIIHIGGDEAPVTRWKDCPYCQRKIQELGIRDEKELRAYFIGRLIDYLNNNNRQTMGWNEIIHEKLQKDTIIQYWLGNKKKLLDVIKRGNRVVISSYLNMYLDHSYSLTSLKRAYLFDPILKGLENYSQNVIGMEAPLWTEWVPNQARLDFQTFPRLTAYAETGWTPSEEKNYHDFTKRLIKFNNRLDVKGVEYAKPEEWNPPILKQLFGFLTIPQAQTKQNK